MTLLPIMRRLLLPGFVTLYVLLSLYVMLIFMLGQGLGGGHDSVYSMLKGTANRPAAYRVLVPAMGRLALSVLPQAVEEHVTPRLLALRNTGVVRQVVRLKLAEEFPPDLQDDHIFETTVMMLVVYGFLLAFIAMLHRLAAALVPDSPAYALTAPVLALLIIPVFAVRFAYIYDFAELFFSAACLYLLSQRRWRAYLGCLAVATLNKETTLFCVFLYFLWAWKHLPRRDYFRIGAAQLAIYAAVKGGLTLYYAGQTGQLLVYQPWFHFLVLLEPPDFYGVLAFAACVMLLLWRWQEKPEFLLYGLWMLVPNTLAYLLFCNPGEYRSFYFSLPVLVLLAAHTLVRVSGIAAGGGPITRTG